MNSRANTVLDICRKKYEEKENSDKSLSLVKLLIESHNNFPTAAGLASSASGYAALAVCLFEFFGLKETFPGEITEIARQGSGSACRSLYGGLVIWEGYTKLKENTNSENCIAKVIQPKEDFEDLEILIIGPDCGEKAISSTIGMKETIKTSELYKKRLENVEETLENLMNKLKFKDYHSAFEIIMKDSNNFHATCLDTFPPLFYINDFTKAIINSIHAYNSHCGENRIAYTVDAGPHSTIIGKSEDINVYLSNFSQVFSESSHWNKSPKLVSRLESLKNSALPSKSQIKEIQQILENEKSTRLFSYLTSVGSGPIKIN